MKAIYLDHAATTPMHPEVIEAMIPVMEQTFGNPSSIHSYGREARKIIDQARAVIAHTINASDKQIVFTSGGTEADNMALIGTALANQQAGRHIITTSIEHHASMHAAEYLQEQGFEVTYLPVTKDGMVSLQDVQEALRPDTILVSVMMINNETGVYQPIEAIGELLQNHQAYFHTDAVQAYGTETIDVEVLGVDLLALSSHKINGPKGVGALYIGSNVKIKPITFGGEQERKRRAGTENVAAIAGFAKAAELAAKNSGQLKSKYQLFKTKFLDILDQEAVEYEINGTLDNTAASIINLSFPGKNVESLLMNFDLAGITASSGSACTAGSIDPSHVLKAMFGAEDPRIKSSIRFSFGSANTIENITEAAQKIAAIVKRLTN